MKKVLISVVLMVWVGAMLPMAAMSGDYQHNLTAGEMSFSWTLEDDVIHIRVSAKTTGWVGIGFNPSVAMKDANIIIGMAKGEKVKIEDHFGDRKRGHSSDKKLGGNDDIKNPSGHEKDGVTTLMFTIPLNSGDKYDTPVKADGNDTVILAHGAGRDSLKTRHEFRATYQVNLKTGEHSEVK